MGSNFATSRSDRRNLTQLRHKNCTSATYHRLSTMSKHNPDLILCRHLAGISIGRLCENDDGTCPICDSYVRPTTLVRICDDCAYHVGEGGKCIICGGVGVSDAYYCAEYQTCQT